MVMLSLVQSISYYGCDHDGTDRIRFLNFVFHGGLILYGPHFYDDAHDEYLRYLHQSPFEVLFVVEVVLLLLGTKKRRVVVVVLVVLGRVPPPSIPCD